MVKTFRSKGIRTGGIPCEPTPAIVLDFTNPVHVTVSAKAVNDFAAQARRGISDLPGQMAFAGAEPVTDAVLAQRRSNMPLRPKTSQQPPGGLWEYEGEQLDLVEMFMDQPED
jgi:hypothetical protein